MLAVNPEVRGVSHSSPQTSVAFGCVDSSVGFNGCERTPLVIPMKMQMKRLVSLSLVNVGWEDDDVAPVFLRMIEKGIWVASILDAWLRQCRLGFSLQL